MVLAFRGRPAVPAIVIPDDQSWTVWGTDPAAEGVLPVVDAGRAALVVMPAHVPDALAEPLEDFLRDVPLGARTDVRAAPVLGGPATPTRAEHQGHQEGHGGHEGHEGHEDHEGHGDMMAITGEPSADGLVMEPIELSVGPLGSPLPGGIVAEVTLDGDVVAGCRVRATLCHAGSTTDAAPPPPDALAPVTWAAATAAAAEADAGVAPLTGAWLRLAVVELERAVSHLAWLRALARLLGWPTLIDAATAALEPLIAIRHHLPVELATPDLPDPRADDATALLDDAVQKLDRVRALGESRRMAQRTQGLGVVGRETAATMGLRGPVARASGVEEDARTGDPRYRRLGFTAAVRHEGDALARTLLRLDEVRASIALVRDALDCARRHVDAPTPLAAATGVTLEGPRGPVRAQRNPAGWHLAAPGEQAALTAAGDAAVGLEWAAALVALVSFDLSPWRVAP